MVAATYFKLVQTMCYQFMSLTDYNRYPTLIDTILRLRAFEFKIQYTINAEGVINQVGDTLLYGRIQFSMGQLRTMVHRMIASTRQDMLKKLLLLQLDSEGEIMLETTPCPVIYQEKLVNNMVVQQARWSFIEDPRNQKGMSVEDLKRWLLSCVQQEKRLRHKFANMAASRVAIVAGGSVMWAKKRIQVYGKAM